MLLPGAHLRLMQPTIYTDASLSGIGMWSLELQTGLYATIHNRTPTSKIFYYEAFVVVCIIHWATQQLTVPQRITIFSDNSNTMDIFNSMKAHGQFNDLLKYAMDLIMTHNIDIWVLHIAGTQNIIADHLSQGRLSSVQDIDDSLVLLSYQPPMDIPGAGLL